MQIRVLISPIAFLLLFCISASAQSKKTKIYTVSSYEPEGNGWVIYHPKFEVTFGWLPVSRTESNLTCWVKYISGDVKGYKYNGKLYTQVDGWPLYKNAELTRVWSVKVSGTIKYGLEKRIFSHRQGGGFCCATPSAVYTEKVSEEDLFSGARLEDFLLKDFRIVDASNSQIEARLGESEKQKKGEKKRKVAKTNQSQEDDTDFWSGGSNSRFGSGKTASTKAIKSDDNFWNGSSSNKDVPGKNTKSKKEDDNFWGSLSEEKTGAKSKQTSSATYKTVTIGKQTWMAENLKINRFRNGDPIPKELHPTDSTYSHDVITDPRGICPEGWRVPTQKDWETLIFLFGDFYDYDKGKNVWNKKPVPYIYRDVSCRCNKESKEYAFEFQSNGISPLVELNVNGFKSGSRYWCSDYYVNQFFDVGQKSAKDILINIPNSSGYVSGAWINGGVRHDKANCIRCIK